MLLWLRGAAKTVSAVLVLLSLWSLPHVSQPDICVPAGFENHDASKHVFTAASEGPHQEHCAVCHWMRSLRPTLAARPYTSTGDGSGAAVVAPTILSRRPSALTQLPPRAPPV